MLDFLEVKDADGNIEVIYNPNLMIAAQPTKEDGGKGTIVQMVHNVTLRLENISIRTFREGLQRVKALR